MTNCNHCQTKIPNDEPYVSMTYHIETVGQDTAGNLSAQVISAETLLTLCQRCAVKNKTAETETSLKRFVLQKGGQSN